MIRVEKSKMSISPNQLLVMNGREGRITISVREKKKGASAGRKLICNMSWFPPRDAVASARVQNREINKKYGSALVEVHKLDPGHAYTFALAICRSRGRMDEIDRMVGWLAEEKQRGTRYTTYDVNRLDNVGARFVRVGSVG